MVSDCVVRTKEDILKVRELSDCLDRVSSWYKGLAAEFSPGQTLGEINLVNDITERLTNVSLIQYDVENFGNSLVSRRERKLLIQIVSKEIKDFKKKQKQLIAQLALQTK
jgi:hypothetical protein